MRVLSRSATLLALLTPIIDAVSLSDMTPRAQNLPPDCNTIYTSQISGCGIPDFTTSSCTDTCVSALQAMVGPIKEACGGQGVTGQNLVVAFLANVGPQQICPNAEVDSSSSSQQPESTPSPTPSPAPSPSTTSTTAVAAETTEASSSSIASESLLVDTSTRESTRTRTRTPAFSGTTTAPSITASQSFAPTTKIGKSSRTSTTTTTAAAAAKASSTADEETEGDGQQAADDQSGGGSPFDDEGNMFSGADSLSSTSVLVSLGIAFVVVVVLFR